MNHGRESVTESMVVEPDSTAGFKQRALVEMQETAMALVGKGKDELPTARTLYVSLDRADNVIEGGPPAESPGAHYRDMKLSIHVDNSSLRSSSGVSTT